jgi:hypothetical protein
MLYIKLNTIRIRKISRFRSTVQETPTVNLSKAQTQVPIKTIIWISVIGFLLISAATVAFSPRLQAFYPLPEDQGSAWYYWQVADFSVAGRVAVWAGYALHQLAVWWIFFTARFSKFRAERQRVAAGGVPADEGPFVNPGSEVGNGYTVAMLVVNLLFVALHLLQTQLWYGGLAQDVPIWTSQGSVIVMLVLVLVLEMPRRGLFFGKWMRVPADLHNLLRRWHGLFISWALVYTFWFHPMEGNWGLMSGFIYMWLLFIQLIIFGSKPHKNRSWVVVLEAFVVIHGTLISVYKELAATPLFFFGFYAMFLITYMHTWKMALWGKLLALAGYVGSLIYIYQFVRGWEHVIEIIFIPVALYGGAVGLWLLGWIYDAVVKKRTSATAESS